MKQGMNPTGVPNFWITEENYYQLTGPGFWNINEVPQERMSQLPIPFNLEKTVALFASGKDPCAINAPNCEKIAGVDWLRLEKNPKQGELPLNVNHFVINTPVSGCYPVYGPYRSGSIAPHWSG
jgi:hypothetical protein